MVTLGCANNDLGLQFGGACVGTGDFTIWGFMIGYVPCRFGWMCSGFLTWLCVV